LLPYVFQRGQPRATTTARYRRRFAQREMFRYPRIEEALAR
jgi:hypothetical protein